MEATSDDELVKAVFKGRVTLSEVMQPGRVSEIRGAILQWGDIGRGKWRALDTTREQANTGLTRHGLLSEFSTTCISLKGTFRAQIAAKDWPEHASANNFDNLQLSPLGHGKSFGESGATFRKSEVLHTIDDCTKVVHVTGHKSPDGQAVWDRVDVWHSAEVISGISIVVQWPIQHPSLPVQKQVYRDHCIFLLIANDESNLTSNVAVTTIQLIPKLCRRTLPRPLIESWCSNARNDLGCRMQAGVQQLWYKDINAGGSRIARHADDESRKVALQSPISKVAWGRYAGALNAEYGVLEGLAKESTNVWTPSEAAARSMFGMSRIHDVRCNLGKKIREKTAAFNESSPLSHFGTPSDPGAKQQQPAIHHMRSYYKVSRASVLSGTETLMRFEFEIQGMKPQELLKVLQRPSYWRAIKGVAYNHESSPYPKVDYVKVEPFDKLKNTNIISVHMKGSRIPWAVLQRVTKEGGGGYQVAHSGCTPLVESLIECKSLADSTGYGDAMPDSFEPYYSTFLLRSKGDETQVTAVVNLQKLMDVPGMAKFFQRKFSAGLSACMEEDKHSGDIPGCGAFKHCVVGLPEPLQKILDGFLAPLSLLNLV